MCGNVSGIQFLKNKHESASCDHVQQTFSRKIPKRISSMPDLRCKYAFVTILDVEPFDAARRIESCDEIVEDASAFLRRAAPSVGVTGVNAVRDAGLG